MERPINNIDELLNRRLHGAEVPPPPFVWPNVERALRRRKRRFFLWFLAAGLVGTGIWTVWSHPFTHTETTPATKSPREAIQPAKQALPQATNPAVPANEQAQQPIAANPALAPVSAPENPKTMAQTMHKGAGKYAQTPAPSILLPETSPATSPASAAASHQPETPGKTDQPAAAAPSDLLIQNNALKLLPHPLAALDNRLREPEMPSAHPGVSKKKAAKKCYDFHTNRQAWLLDAYAGPSLVRKSLESSNPEYRDYIADRLQTERQEIAFNAGVRASYLFAENFIIRTGLHYDQFTEKFEFIDPNFINTTIRIKQQLVNGQWVTVTDTVIEYGANYVKTYNRFGLLDIPLQAALELRNGPTGISLNLGGSVNILFWKRGSMLDTDGKPARFTPDKRQLDIFQPRVGLSLLGSVQWYYHLGPKTRFFAEPYYRHILEPVTRPGYPVKQSYGIGGIRFGLTKILDVN